MPGGKNGPDTEFLATQTDERATPTSVTQVPGSVDHDCIEERFDRALLLGGMRSSILGRSSGFPVGRDHREGDVCGSMQSGFGLTLPQGPGPWGFLKKRSSTPTRRMVGSILA